MKPCLIVELAADKTSFKILVANVCNFREAKVDTAPNRSEDRLSVELKQQPWKIMLTI